MQDATLKFLTGSVLFLGLIGVEVLEGQPPSIHASFPGNGSSSEEGHRDNRIQEIMKGSQKELALWGTPEITGEDFKKQIGEVLGESPTNLLLTFTKKNPSALNSDGQVIVKTKDNSKLYLLGTDGMRLDFGMKEIFFAGTVGEAGRSIVVTRHSSNGKSRYFVYLNGNRKEAVALGSSDPGIDAFGFSAEPIKSGFELRVPKNPTVRPTLTLKAIGAPAEIIVHARP